MRQQHCFITDADRCRLGTLLSSCEGKAWGRAACLRILDDRLEDARAVDSDRIPKGLVTMNSKVELINTSTGKRRRISLVYPEDCELVPDSVSVLCRFGTQLLGSEMGDVLSDGKQHFRVSKILYQPETAGDRHL